MLLISVSHHKNIEIIKIMWHPQNQVHSENIFMISYEQILYLRLNISVQTIDILLEAIILVVSCVALRIGIPKIECKYTFTPVLMMPKKQSTDERSTTIYCVQPYNTQIPLFGGLHEGVVVVVLLASWPQIWIQLLLLLPTWMKALLGISFQISLLKHAFA